MEVAVFFALFAIYASVNGQVGSYCTMHTTQIRGICRFSYDCPEAAQAEQNGIPPTLCENSFIYLQSPIVCCYLNSEDVPKENPNIFPNDEDIQKENYENRPSNNYFERPVDIIYENNEKPNIFNSNEQPNTFNTNERPFNGIPSKDSIIFGESVDRQRKCEKKCEEYSKDLQGVVQAIPLVTNTEVVTVKTDKCVHGVPLIVGGEPANEGEFPYMAALGFFVDSGIDWRCGATLISELYVVTAAHCTFSRDVGDPRIVRLGEIDLTRERGGPTHVDYSISKIIAHPNYSYPFKYNDIALIKLDRRVHFNKYIRPACLNTKRSINRPQSIATGFGKTEFAASENHNKLLKVALNIYDNSRCARSFRNDKRTLPKGIVETMLCAGEIEGGKDTCQGDSGGPLVITDANNHCKFYLIGVTSFGKACGEANTAGVYTRVSEYIDWIEEIVW